MKLVKYKEGPHCCVEVVIREGTDSQVSGSWCRKTGHLCFNEEIVAIDIMEMNDLTEWITDHGHEIKDEPFSCRSIIEILYEKSKQVKKLKENKRLT